MDKQKALAVLGLTRSAGLQEAKAAYRRLAKQHHPDHFARDEAAAIRAESRMKDINLAYRFLAPLLSAAPRPNESKPRKAPAPESNPRPGPHARHESAARAASGAGATASSKAKAPPGEDVPPRKKAGAAKRNSFSDVFSRLKKQFNRPGRSFSPSSSEKPGPAKQTARPGKTGRKRPLPRFDKVLEPLSPGSVKGSGTAKHKGEKKRFRTGKSAPYDNYLRYMDLKKKVKARTRRRDQTDSGKVESITRIRPVNPVGKD